VKSWFDQIDEDVAKAVIRIKVKLPNGEEIDRDFRGDIAIDYDLLEEQLTEMPGMFAWWSSVLAEQRARVMVIERKIKARRGMVTQELLDESKKIAASGGGIGTRAGLRREDIKDLMEKDVKMIKLDATYIQEKRTESKLYGIVEALRMKSEHLRSLAGFKRMEMQQSNI